VADAFSALFVMVRGRLNEAGQRWLEGAVSEARAGDVNRVAASYTAASRQAGMAQLDADAAERASLAAIAPGLSSEHWTVADAARAVLLLAGGQDASDERRFVRAALTCFENGDAREQQSWLRAVSLLPHDDRFTAVAVDACRSHIQPTFEAIACENPYASIRFSERQFNQMVLKAMFTGVRLERIVNLPRRVNPDLSQMARDYAAERRAAGRTVPPDLVLALHDAPALEEHLS
jgi:hypothetical protein